VNYEEIKQKEKLFSKLPKRSLVSYLKYLVLYILNLHSRIKLLENEISEEKLKQINLKVNCPSSKMPEWNKDIDKSKKKEEKKKKKRTKNKGSGNKGKEHLEPTSTTIISNKDCPHCGFDLTEEIPFESITRIIEDIMEVQKKTEVIKEIQERVKCPLCKTKVTAQSEAALPKSDIGLNATVLIAYLWVWMATSLPKITDFLNSFFSMTISTSGISKMMIRLGKILEPVYDEILGDIKAGAIIYADETGWRVRGILHWLWIFANKESAFYWPDSSRGGAVVEKIIGTCFNGLLSSDAWHAYLKIKCRKQTCMAHIFRKIRTLKDEFPQYYSIFRFYEKLKLIIADGEKLQGLHHKITEEQFNKGLIKIRKRLDDLLLWKNPNEILTDIIKKVQKQREYILTFIEYPEAESHNNYAEYIVKKGILKRKVSGGSTSFEGLFAFSVLISIYQTCHLRKLSASHFLKKSLVKYIRTGTPMLLSEYQNFQIKI
jgi:hypothetical protein